MCGRYHFAARTMEQIENFLTEQNIRLDHPAASWPQGDIFPSRQAPVLKKTDGAVNADPLTWGYTGYNSRLIINARSETAAQKPSFRKDLEERRCIVPAAWYYEWSREKKLYSFTVENQPVLFMAGLFHPDGRFTILTRAASGQAGKIHDRMPVLVAPSEVYAWLTDPSSIAKVFSRKAEDLTITSDLAITSDHTISSDRMIAGASGSEQMSLWE